jgi:hypothetical protein
MNRRRVVVAGVVTVLALSVLLAVPVLVSIGGGPPHDIVAAQTEIQAEVAVPLTALGGLGLALLLGVPLLVRLGPRRGNGEKRAE